MAYKPDSILKAESKLKQLILDRMDSEFKWLQKQAERFAVTEKGVIKPTAENLAIRADIAAKLERLQLEWVNKTFASEEWLAKNTVGIPNTEIAGALKFAYDYTNQDINARVLLYEQLTSAVDSINVINKTNHSGIRNIFGTAIRTPGTTYQDLIDALQQNYKTAPGHAQTIVRGVLMETFRGVNAQAANEYAEDYGGDEGKVEYQHVGPAPVPMPDGHLLCVNHYGEVHTLDKWEEIAQQYIGAGDGLDPNMLLQYCGGYNCRHALRPITRDNVRQARGDTKDYKREQQRTNKELEELNNA